ncbi:MAG: hypothetical protein RLZZ516_2773 [Cyanobacteriota bacterium]
MVNNFAKILNTLFKYAMSTWIGNHDGSKIFRM